MFTPVAHNRICGFSLGEVMDWVIEGSSQAARDYHINSRLIASVNRHEDPALAAEVADLAAQRQERGIVAINLAGNEADFPAAPFKNVFLTARSRGLAITMHAGEWNSAANVSEAILDFQTSRVSHGVRVLEDPAVVQLARQRQTPFEVCLSSNVQTGVVASIQEHPLPLMLAAGLNVCLNTDDPGVQGITLTDDFFTAHHILGLSVETLARSILAAANASFLPSNEKEKLRLLLIQHLAEYIC